MSTVTTGVAYGVVARRRVTPLHFLRTLADAILRFALFLAIGFATGLSAAVAVPSVFGFTSLDELSGSMSPAIRVGDEVIEKRIAPLDARIGDIVTFRSPQTGRILTHRVVQMRVDGGNVAFVTQGDANSGFEKWAVSRQGTIGKVMARIPRLGYITNRAGSRLGRVGLIVLPVLLLGLFELRRIWRS